MSLELHTSSFGPVTGSFGGGPRIPRQGQSTDNLNALPPPCPELFPTTDQQGYLRDAYPLQPAPIWGFRGDQQQYDPETGAVLQVPELPVDQRPRSAPITLGDWLKADQKSTVRVRLTEYDRRREAFTAAVFTFQFRDLIPHAVYTIWGIRLNTLLNPPPGEDISLPNPLCLPNVFSSDARGRARFECTVVHPLPSLQGPEAPLRLMGATVAFHPTYQNWGACFARYGVAVDHSVHLTTGLSALNALTTRARQ